MRIRVWSPVQVVPDVTGTKQHTEQMFVVDTYSKNRIFRATKRNIKHEGASKRPMYVQITVSLRQVLLGKLIRCTECWKS